MSLPSSGEPDKKKEVRICQGRFPGSLFDGSYMKWIIPCHVVSPRMTRMNTSRVKPCRYFFSYL